MSFLDIRPTVPRESKIKLHGPEAFAGMRKAGRLVAEALDMITDYVHPGVTTERLDDLVLEFALDNDAVPAPLNYRGYTKSICTSLNHVVCHGIPGPRPLREGDIVNIDITLILDGHGDSSRMYPVGEISRKAERLIEVTYEAMMRGIAAVRPGATTGDIGASIQHYAEAERCSIVRDFCGHGLGRVFHDRPNILHYGEPGEGIRSARHAVHRRADDQSRQAACEDALRRLDSGHARPFALRPVRACGGCDPDRLRGLYLFSARLAQAALSWSGAAPMSAPGFKDASPHYVGHRERLRDRFRQAGADALPDYELLELILFRAIPRRDVKPLAKIIINAFGSFAEAISASEDRLAEIPGLGAAAITEIKLVRAAALRLMQGELAQAPALELSDKVVNYCRAAMAHEAREQFRVLFLDNRNRLLADEVQGRGTVNHTPVYVREVVKRALELSASSIILVHNHPSGDPTPSRADIDITKQIIDAAKKLEISVHDHIIVGRDGHLSLRSAGLV